MALKHFYFIQQNCFANVPSQNVHISQEVLLKPLLFVLDFKKPTKLSAFLLSLKKEVIFYESNIMSQ